MFFFVVMICAFLWSFRLVSLAPASEVSYVELNEDIKGFREFIFDRVRETGGGGPGDSTALFQISFHLWSLLSKDYPMGKTLTKESSDRERTFYQEMKIFFNNLRRLPIPRINKEIGVDIFDLFGKSARLLF